MSLKDQMNADAGLFLNTDEFADTVLYNGVSISAVVELGDSPEKGNMIAAYGESSRAEVWVASADVPNPKRGDVVNYLDTDWTVMRVLESAGGLHRLECTANESVFPFR